MTIKDVSPERLAELYHHYLEALAPDFGFTNGWTWSEIPDNQRTRIVAATRLALIELNAEPSSAADEEFDRRRYFAKPGEAEWGC